MGDYRNIDGKFYEVLYDYSFIDQSYEFTYPENKNSILNQCPSLVPVPGFCFQSRTRQNKTAYINICHAIELPNCNVYNSRIHMREDDGDDSFLGFNIYLDDERLDRDDNGKICICYDAIIQTEFMDAIFSHTHRDQRLNYLCRTACKAIYDRYNVRLEKDVELLKKFYHGNMPESFRNIFKKLGFMSKSNNGNIREPYFSDPFNVITSVRRFYTERKPEFDIKNPSIDYEFRKFPAEGEYKGFMLQAILPYFSFLDPRDLKVFVARKKLIIRENKTNHQFYFYLPNSVSVMDCRIHYHDGRLTLYLPRLNPSSCRTLGQYRRRPDPPRIVPPHDSPPAQPNIQQVRTHPESTKSEVTNSQLVTSQVSHHQQPSSQVPPRPQYPPHYQPNFPKMDSHQSSQSHINQPPAVPSHSTHFQPSSQRNHFQSNAPPHMNTLRDGSPQMSRMQSVHYPIHPSQTSQHIPSQMAHPQMAPSRMGHLQHPSQIPQNRVNPHYMGRYQAGPPLMDRLQGNSLQMSRPQVNPHQMVQQPMEPTHINHHQPAPHRMEHRQAVPPQIAQHQASPAQMNQLQMASSHLAQLQTVLSRQVHLKEAPSLLARLQATLSQVEDLKAKSMQQTKQEPCPITNQEAQTGPQKAQPQNLSQDKDSNQASSMQIAEIQAALNEISDLQKALLEAANFQVANLQAAILQITTPQKEDIQNPPPPPQGEVQATTPQTPHSQPSTESETIQTPFTQPEFTQPSVPSTKAPTPTSSP